MHEELLDRWSDYPILARTTYVISNSFGAMHRESRDRLSRYADEWASAGVADLAGVDPRCGPGRRLGVALARGFVVRSPHDPEHRGGHVTIDTGDGQRVHDRPHEPGFAFDHRPGAGLRLAPHFCNTAEEGAAALDEIASIRKEMG